MSAPEAAWHAQTVNADEPQFRVTFVAPSGSKYEVTCSARSEVGAVRLADETLEYVERIGISDCLCADGITVQSPAQLQVERVERTEATSGFGLVITDPDGTETRK